MKKISFYFVRIFFGVLFISLFFIPLSIFPLNLLDVQAAKPAVFSIFDVITGSEKTKTLIQSFSLSPFFYIQLYLPLSALFLLASLFIKKNTDVLCRFIILFGLTLYVFIAAVCMITFANCLRWFFNLPPYVYAAVLVCLVCHIYMTFYSISHHKNSKTEYETIKKIKEQEAESSEKKGWYLSIKIKVLLTILTTIIALLSIFTFFILRDYKKMITAAVSDMGRSKAEQTAAVYESADGKNDKIAQFFSEQARSNAFSNTPFERIDVIIAKDPEPLYLEEIDSNTILPPYNVFAYTTGRPGRVPEEEKAVSAEDAWDYLKRYQKGSYRIEPVYDKVKRTSKYIHPVTLSRARGHRLYGFAIVIYRTELLMEEYFQTQVFVFTLGAAFLYIVVIITIFLSDFITTPLIYLRYNVHDSTTRLSAILSGGGKVGYDALDFNDDIKSKDEIRDLSLEIGNLISLIRGIIPFISNATLKYADRDSNPRLSVIKDLCFLFTDIRGFTSMCEGRPAKEVVNLLNHYLELEAQIIIKNHGDIDKFAGDEMMAFFSGARKEYNACKAAMEIRTAMREEQKRSLEKGKTIVSMGIGINSGKVVFGSVGSRTRMDFTSIGDTVNLAARLEGANKAYGSKAIISEAVYKNVQEYFVCRELDLLTVKGKKEPVRIYEILQSEKKAEKTVYDIKELFEKGLKYYRQQNWDKAESAFSECSQRFGDMPSVIFLDRIRHFRKSPPDADWNGVFNLKVK